VRTAGSRWNAGPGQSSWQALGASLVRFLPREMIDKQIPANRVRRRYHGDSFAEPATFCGLYMGVLQFGKIDKM
jgi:hypothetical protein